MSKILWGLTMNFIDPFFFLIVLLFVYFLPGYFFLGIFRINLTFFEHFLFSFFFSFILIIFLSILLYLLNIPINRISIIISIIMSILVFLQIIIFIQKRGYGEVFSFKDNFFLNKINFTIFLTIILFLLGLYFKALYVQYLPYGTDLGHHSFWAKYIITTGELPNYGSNQFVIGESILLAMPFLISKLSLNSVYSLILLSFFHLLGLMAVLVLSFRIFNKQVLPALISFFLIAIPYIFLPPNFNFILSGVVGNLLGSFISIGLIYFFYRFFIEKEVSFIFLTLISAFGLIYVHNLTIFLFLLVFLFFILIYFLFSQKEFISSAKYIFKIFSDIKALIFLAFIIGIFFLMIPSYLVYTDISNVFTKDIFKVYQIIWGSSEICVFSLELEE